MKRAASPSLPSPGDSNGGGGGKARRLLPGGTEAATVLPQGTTATDNLLLRCAGGQHVLTNADLLIMLSPGVLGDALSVARRDHQRQQQATSGGSGGTGNSAGGSSAADSASGGDGRGTASSTASGSDNSGSGGACGLPVLPLEADGAGDWVLALRLVHPLMVPEERPCPSWVRAWGLWGGGDEGS